MRSIFAVNLKLSSTPSAHMKFTDRFRTVAGDVSCAFGSLWALATAALVVLVWAVTGPYFGYSNGWQLVINTGTTIVTFLMAFLIQATQYRESKAINLKIDELLRAVEGARTGFVNLESLSEAELDSVARELQRLGRHAGTASLPARSRGAAASAAKKARPRTASRQDPPKERH